MVSVSQWPIFHRHFFVSTFTYVSCTYCVGMCYLRFQCLLCQAFGVPAAVYVYIMFFSSAPNFYLVNKPGMETQHCSATSACSPSTWINSFRFLGCVQSTRPPPKVCSSVLSWSRHICEKCACSIGCAISVQIWHAWDCGMVFFFINKQTTRSLSYVL